MHQTLALKQSEWNIVVMGNNKYKNQCKRVHFKNVVIETQEKVVRFRFIKYGSIKKFDFIKGSARWKKYPNNDKLCYRTHNGYVRRVVNWLIIMSLKQQRCNHIKFSTVIQSIRQNIARLVMMLYWCMVSFPKELHKES